MFFVVVVVLFFVFYAFRIARFSLKHFFLGLFLRSFSTELFFLVASLFSVLSVTAFCYGDFFQLSDCVLFSIFIGLLPVRVFPGNLQGCFDILSSFDGFVLFRS